MSSSELSSSIVLKLQVLKASCANVESLVNKNGKPEDVRHKLEDINNEFDNLLASCDKTDADATMPGNSLAKIEAAAENAKQVRRKVQSWLDSVELPRASIVPCGSKSRVPVECASYERGSVKCLDNLEIGSKGSSRCSSRVRECRVKWKLAQLECQMEEDKCFEEERFAEVVAKKKELESKLEAQKKEFELKLEVEKRELELMLEAEQRAMKAKAARRKLQLAEAEKSAWEEESVGSLCNKTARETYPAKSLSAKSTPFFPNQKVPYLEDSTPLVSKPEFKPIVNDHFTESVPLLRSSGGIAHQLNLAGEAQTLSKRETLGMADVGASGFVSTSQPANPEGRRSYSEHTNRHLQEDLRSVRFNAPPPGFERPRTKIYAAPEVSERYLPKPSIEEFDGNPLDYWAFVNRFQIHVAERVNSDDLRLVYLLQHCSKRVHEKLKHFAGGPDARVCYRAVWQELYRRYGQPHVISRCCEERLMNVSKISQHDAEGLENFAVLLKQCCASLAGTREPSTVNSVNFLAALAQKLPSNTRHNWISKALEFEQRNSRLATFVDFAEFVINESERANSTFYKAIFHSEQRKEEHSKRVQGRSFASTSNAVKKAEVATVHKAAESNNKSNEFVCVYCSKKHGLEKCPEFKELSFRDRKRFIVEKRLCFRCLLGCHLSRDCDSKVLCKVKSCKRTNTHHTLLHLDQPVKASQEVSAATICGTTIPVADSDNSSDCEETYKTYLDIVPVRVRCDNVEVLTYALLDSGSSLSFCSSKLIDVLGVNENGIPTKAQLETLTTEGPKSVDTKVFDLEVLSLNGSNKFKLSKVMLVERIPVNLECRNVGRNLSKHEHLQGVELPVIKGATVTLLIGCDHALLHFPVETRPAPDPDQAPQAVKTPLGWILKGPDREKEQSFDGSSAQINMFMSGYRVPGNLSDLNDLLVTDDGEVFPSPFDFDTTNVDELMQWLKSNRELKEFGLKYSREDTVAYDLMSRSVCQVDGHYQLPLLWKNAAVTFPDSLQMAQNRLKGVKRRLQRDSQLKDKYQEQMDIALKKGYAERVPDGDAEQGLSERLWVIPHHPVINPKKPEKVRVVFDCAARSHNTSLNENLMTGPDLVNKLVKVLLRFRKDKIAIVSDIEAMFYQVLVSPEDRDSLRFLWWPEGNLDAEPVLYRMKVHLFGATSSPSCAAFALRLTAKEYSKFFPPNVAETVLKSFYVDDLLTSANSVETAVTLIHHLRNLMQKGGFKLTKWISSSKEVMQTVPLEERAKIVQDLSLSNVENRVLGMNWNIDKDAFTFEVSIEDKPPTRRFVLSVTNRLFDPLGLVAPVIVEARLIFRDLCKLKVKWDEPLPTPHTSRWTSWINSLHDLRKLSIRRCFQSEFDDVTNAQIHVFADASTLARGAVCYIRAEHGNGHVDCNIVMAKALLASSESMTIPRMELEAAVDAVKLACLVKDEFGLHCQCTYWTDSSIVIKSIQADSKRFPVFSRNRLAQIEKRSSIHEWRHLPSELNPADLISRGVRVSALLEDKMWFEGPNFLKLQPDQSPNQFVKNQSCDEELVHSFDLPTKGKVSMLVNDNECCGTDRLIEFFSSFYRLKLVVAWLLRVKLCMRERLKCSESVLNMSAVSVSELNDAETSLLKYVQRTCFSKCYDSLQKGSLEHVTKSSPLYKLNPILVDGLIRVGGRLNKAYLEFEVRHPGVVPEKHHLTELIVQDVHSRVVGHFGVEATLNQVCKRYWILNAKGQLVVVCNRKMRLTLVKKITCRESSFFGGEYVTFFGCIWFIKLRTRKELYPGFTFSSRLLS